jgi:hypothetical protein
MDKKSRKVLLIKIAASAGILTSFVEQNLDKDSFRRKFLATPEGPERENLVYNAVVAAGKPAELTPITVNGPGGIKLTYNVMPDYVKVNGIRVTIAPSTAQRIAARFNMSLPTDKMSQQIYNAADIKTRAIPLSGSGYVGSDGKRYSGEDVAKERIGKADAALKYNEATDDAIKKEQAKTGNQGKLIAGHGKDILQPTNNPNDVRIGGWHGADGKPLQPYSDTHKGEALRHSEYGLFTRLVDSKVLITTPDGKTIETTLDKIQNHPELAKLIAAGPGVKKYTTA